MAFTLGLFAFGAVAGLQALVVRQSPTAAFSVSDFRVIYCGGEAVRHHNDPYLVEPLRSCEHRVGREFREPDWAVTPVPLPGYTLAAVLALSLVPFALAKLLWIALLISALAVAAATLAAVVQRSTVAVMLILTPTVGILNLRYGEPVLLAIAALCISAWLIKQERPGQAAVAAGIAMLEPHVGLPGVVALFVLVPESRRTLALTVAALTALSVATLGVHGNIEYFRNLLPSQARAELIATDQYSVSHIAFLLGAPAQAALTLGSLSYLITMAIGVLVAKRIAADTELRAAIVVVPVALAMLGGPFVHDVQIASALPAAIILSPRSWPARLAIVLLIVQWSSAWRALPVLTSAALFGAAVVAYPRSSLRFRATCAFAGMFVTLGVLLLLPAHDADRRSNVIGTPSTTMRSDDLSSLPWSWRIELVPANSVSDARSLVEKVPTWIGLALIPFSLLGYSARCRALKATLSLPDRDNEGAA